MLSCAPLSELHENTANVQSPCDSAKGTEPESGRNTRQIQAERNFSKDCDFGSVASMRTKDGCGGLFQTEEDPRDWRPITVCGSELGPLAIKDVPGEPGGT